MKRNGTEAAAFASKLRREMRLADHESVRAFGKLADPENPERGRRRLQRHLSGKTMPSRASRRLYAKLLGLDPNHFEPEEPDLAALMAALHRKLQAHRLAVAT